MAEKKKILPPTKSTPEVILDPKGLISMTGRLIPENALNFFNPIEEWVNAYFLHPAEFTSVDINLEYVNSVGTKYLLDMLHLILNIYLRKNDKKFRLNFYYEECDEDMFEKGTFFSSVLDVPFNFIIIG